MRLMIIPADVSGDKPRMALVFDDGDIDELQAALGAAKNDGAELSVAITFPSNPPKDEVNGVGRGEA